MSNTTRVLLLTTALLLAVLMGWGLRSGHIADPDSPALSVPGRPPQALDDPERSQDVVALAIEGERQASPDPEGAEEGPYIEFLCMSGPGGSGDSGVLPWSGHLYMALNGSVPLRVPIVRGRSTLCSSQVAGLELEPSLQGRLELRPKSVHFNESELAWSITENRTYSFDGKEHELWLRAVDGWPLTITSSTGVPNEDGDVAVWLEEADSWRWPSPGQPPQGVRPLDLKVEAAELVLPSPHNETAVYWIKARNHSWFAFRWVSREEIGHAVTLAATASVEMAGSAKYCEEKYHLRLSHTNAMWRSQAFAGLDMIACSDDAQEADAGAYSAELYQLNDREACLAAFSLVLEPGAKCTIILDQLLDVTSLELVLTGQPPESASEYQLWNTGYYGGPRGIVEQDPTIQYTDGGVAVRWERVQRGVYAVQVSGHRSYLVQVDPREGESSEVVAWPQSTERHLYLPDSTNDDGSSDLSADPVWTKLAIIGQGSADLRNVYLPPSKIGGIAGRIMKFLASDTDTARVAYADPGGNAGFTIELGTSSALEAPPSQEQWVVWESENFAPPIGWAEGVRFQRGKGEESEPSSTHVRTNQDGVVGVGIRGFAAEAVYLPRIAGSAVLGGWFTLPEVTGVFRLNDLDTESDPTPSLDREKVPDER